MFNVLSDNLLAMKQAVKEAKKAFDDAEFVRSPDDEAYKKAFEAGRLALNRFYETKKSLEQARFDIARIEHEISALHTEVHKGLESLERKVRH